MKPSPFASITRRIIALTLLTLAMPMDAWACWIEKVVAVEDELHVYIARQIMNAVYIVVRTHDTGSFRNVPTKAEGYFVLREGDEARLELGAHDWCIVTAKNRPEGLGVQTDAKSRPHGMPLDEVRNFIAGEKQ